MKSNYKRLGDYIQLVDVRNKDLKVKTLLGLTVNKMFIPSVANTIGTNMANYKIIRKNQFACSLMQVRRDKKMPVALLKDYDEAIISQAYPVFEVIDTNDLNPEYLMMWFSRKEFDRHALFLAVGGVRGSLEWEDFMNTELPVPIIEKQNEIVKEYNTVVNRIKLNEQLNQKLEETAQAIYKYWFVDFEFPNEDGKAYKSSGGKMVYNEELDKEIPEGWEVRFFDEFANFYNGFSYRGEELMVSRDALITIKNFSKDGLFKIRGYKEIKTDRVKDYQFANEGDVIVAHTDLTKGIIIGKSIMILDSYNYKNLIISMDTVKVTSKSDYISNALLNKIINDKSFNDFALGYVNGSTVIHMSKKALPNYRLSIPTNLSILSDLSKKLELFFVKQKILQKEESKLIKMKDLLLLKMTKG